MSSNKLSETPGHDLENGMMRDLQNRHVQIIAIAGTIGTGLFLGAGTAINQTGPSILFVYALTGIFMYFMMRAMGEMFYQDPDQHTFINFITRYLGPSWGYFAGWSYWLSLLLIGMAEITAVASYVQFWFPDIPAWLIQIVFLAILSSINFIAVKLFGEAELWFGIIKIATIISLIATAIFMLVTNFKTPEGAVSLTNVTSGFKWFPNGFMNFIVSFQMVFFAYQAIEFVGITVSETANPRKVLPKAIKQIPIRIVIFYVGALLALMTITPWRSLGGGNGHDIIGSPFVKVFDLIGFKWAAGLINFVVLTVAASALNATLYSTGRHLYQLAHESPNKLMTTAKLNALAKTGVPSRAIIFSAIMIAFSAFISIIPGVKNAFDLIAASSSGVYISIYILTMIAHLKYRQSQDFMEDGFIMPAYRILNPLTILFMIGIYIILFLQDSTVIAAIGSTIWIIGFGAISYLKFSKQ